MIHNIVKSIVDVMNVNSKTFTFGHTQQSVQNINADQIELPVVFLNMPVKYDSIVTDSGFIQYKFKCELWFLYKSNIDDGGGINESGETIAEQQQIAIFNEALAAQRQFLNLLPKSVDVKDYNATNAIQVQHVFDADLSGVYCNIEIEPKDYSGVCTDSLFPTPNCPKSGYLIIDEDGNVILQGSLEAGQILNATIQSSNVQNSDGTFNVDVLPQNDLVLPNETILVVNTNMDIIASDTNRPSVKDGSIEVPNVDNIDSDGLTVSTPAGVPFTCTPVVPCPPVVSSAKLLKTGQTVSYFSKDDGDLQKGREVDFFTLPENNPFGNTDRFTDTLGGQTYTNDIVIDWSTYDGNTVLAYYRVMGGVDNWEDSVLNASSLSIGGFTSGWRLTNAVEFNNLHLFGNGRPMTWTPLNQPNLNLRYWTSTTLNNYTNQPYYGSNFFGSGGVTGTQSYNWLSCRDFTLAELGL